MAHDFGGFSKGVCPRECAAVISAVMCSRDRRFPEPHVGGTLQVRALLAAPVALYFPLHGSSRNVRGGAEQLL